MTLQLPDGPALLALIDSRQLYRRETYAATGVCFVSNSTLKSTAACSTQAVLSALGYGPLDGDSPPIAAGVACHEALAVWFRGGTVEEALDAFRAHYYTFAAERGIIESDDRLSYSNVFDVLRAWLEWAEHNFPYRRLDPSLTEVPFLVPLLEDGSIVLGGRIDTFVGDASGTILLTDHKTTGKLDNRFINSFAMDSQFSTYLWGARQDAQRAGLRPDLIIGGIVNAIQLTSLPKPGRKCSRPPHAHGVDYAECRDLHLVAERIGVIERTAAFLDDAWLPTARALAQHHKSLLDAYPDVSRLHEVPMEGQFNGACAQCDFADFCRQNRPLDLIDSMLRREPYTNPLEEPAHYGDWRGLEGSHAD